LLDDGYAVSVLDISANALHGARARLGPRAAEARWIVAHLAAVRETRETHLTPWGKPQSFQHSVFRRV
jgi:hypothetical protein